MVICSQLEDVTGGATESEIAHLGYLACLLSVYNGAPPSDWGYDFAATSSASPFSVALDSAIQTLANNHTLESGSDGLRLSPTGKMELEQYGRLVMFRQRRTILDAACGSVVAVPLSGLSHSLSAEPQLRRALALSSTRPLLDEGGRQAIMAHFEALAAAVPTANDLFVPAVVWLSYLSQQASKSDSHSGEL